MASQKHHNYLKGITWFILSLIISVSNDVLQKYLGDDIPSVQITFMRFLFGTLCLLPFMFYFRKKAFYTSRIELHIIRSILLFGAIALWCFGLTQAPITVATTITFTVPMFVLILAYFFLKEKIGWPRWVATIIGFIGATIAIEPTSVHFSPLALLLILSAFFFATLDVINKKYVVKESMLAMLFYTALFTVVIASVPAYFVWKALTLHQFVLLFLLGCGANLILYCLLKAFKYADASAIAPFRYVELILSAGFSIVIFKEIPSIALISGILIIVPCTMYFAYIENKHEQEEPELVPETETVIEDAEKTQA